MALDTENTVPHKGKIPLRRGTDPCASRCEHPRRVAVLHDLSHGDGSRGFAVLAGIGESARFAVVEMLHAY